MNFGFLQDLYDGFNKGTLNSDLTVNATIFITAENIGNESFYKGMSDSLDARQQTTIRKKYPRDLSPFYRIQVYKIDSSGLRLSDSQQYNYGPIGHQEPYDVWISCEKKLVSVKNNKTIFDFSNAIAMGGIRFNIKGIVSDNFGNEPIVHVFLNKESS